MTQVLYTENKMLNQCIAVAVMENCILGGQTMSRPASKQHLILAYASVSISAWVSLTLVILYQHK